jgi:outer membrane protein assembly factor BamB
MLYHLFCLLLLILPANAWAENWPAWRGPRGDGVSRETDLPVAWNRSQGIAWSAPLPQWGNSTPVIWNDAIFLTSNPPGKLLAIRIEKATGAIAWTREVGSGAETKAPAPHANAPSRGEQKFHELHNLATPSPATNGEVVVVHFGNGDLAAYNFSGKQLWKHNLQDEYGKYTNWWGHANSPVIAGDLVISVCMQDSLTTVQPEKPAQSYLVAHDLQSGRERWKTLRMTGADAEEGDAYTTPLLMEADGRQQLLVMGGNQLDAYDPRDGRQLWFLPGLKGGRTVTGLTIADKMIFATRGMRGPTFALPLPEAAPEKRELSLNQIAWKYNQGTPDSCSPVVWQNWLFTVTDEGIARCFDAASGQLKWKQRLKGNYKASPVAAEGRIYFLNTSGLCTLVEAGERFVRLAENELGDTFLASPAISEGRIYLRGHKALYAIGRRS